MDAKTDFVSIKRSHASFWAMIILVPVALILVWLSQSGLIGTPLKRANLAYKNGEYTKAFELYEPLAESGNQRAQSMVGWFYDNGYGVPVDDVEAAKWYLLAFNQGDANAAENLAALKLAGSGVPQNLEEARALFGVAAATGLPGAQLAYGQMLMAGEGGPIDKTQGLLWVSRAAEQGIAMAQYTMGQFHLKDSHAYGAETTAVKFFEKAAMQGLTEAQIALGRIYEAGDGVRQSYVRAYLWYATAAKTGSREARAMRDRAYGLLTARQTGEASRRLELCEELGGEHCLH